MRTYVREWAAVITVMALIASASEHFKHFWLSATSSGGACVTNTRVQFCDELVHLKYFELLQPWRRQHPVKFLFLFFLEGALSLLLTFFLSLLSASAFSHAEKPADEKRTQNTSVHVTQRTHARLTKAQTHGCCKCRHTKPFLLNTSNAVNPFNRFSVAMATCCRLTEQDVTKKKKPFFLGDRWRHPETSDGSGACVCICVQKVNELMCLCVNVLSISSLPPMMKPAVSEGRGCSFVTDITLCSVKNNQLACTFTQSVAQFTLVTPPPPPPLHPSDCGHHYLTTG